MLLLFGTPRFEGPGHTALLPGKAGSLFAYLLMSPQHRATREELATFFWPDATADAAYANLRQLLASIRRCEAASGIRALTADRTNIVIAPTLSSDLGVILEASASLGSGDASQALQYWAPKLLAGEERALGERYGWLVSLRDRVAGQFYDLLQRQIAMGSLEARQKVDQLFSADPGDEVLFHLKLDALGEAPSFATVLSAYRSHRSALLASGEPDPPIETRRRVVAVLTAGPPISPLQVDRSALPRILILPPSEQSRHTLVQSFVEDVTIALTRMRTFSVLAPFTAGVVAHEDPLLAFALRADYLLSTRLLAEKTPRLKVLLRKADSDEILLADELSLDQHSLLHEHNLAVRAVSMAISAQIARAERPPQAEVGSGSAYVEYLRGTENLRDPSNLAKIRRAKRHFRASIELVPHYSPSIGGLSRALTMEWLLLNRTERQLLEDARRLAARCIEIDPAAHFGYRELGHSSLYLNDIDEAISQFEAASARAPHHADILADRADAWVHASGRQTAKNLIDAALELNPFAPDEYLWISASAEFFLGNFDPAYRQLSKMRDDSMVQRLKAAAAIMIGRSDLALKHRDRWLAQYPHSRVDEVAKFLPHRNREDMELYVGALRLAGFP